MLDDGAASGAAPDPSESDSAADPPAVVRFRTCRWHDGEDESAEYCSHGEVLPYAGRNGFKPEAWCPECSYHKVRRHARKRDADLDY